MGQLAPEVAQLQWCAHSNGNALRPNCIVYILQQICSTVFKKKPLQAFLMKRLAAGQPQTAGNLSFKCNTDPDQHSAVPRHEELKHTTASGGEPGSPVRPPTRTRHVHSHMPSAHAQQPPHVTHCCGWLSHKRNRGLPTSAL